MGKFHKLKVAEVEKLTKDAVLVAFEVPETLIDNYAFKAGQYLTLQTTIEGEEVRRSYSLCSSPSEKAWKVGIKKVPSGKFSSFANEKLSPGMEIEVMEPNGNFIHEPSTDEQQLFVGIAAGSGITPILSIIKESLHTNPNGKFILIFGNQFTDTIMFCDEINELKNTYLDRFMIFHIMSQEKMDAPLLSGRINNEKLAAFSNSFFKLEDVNSYFLCGPEQMILDSKAWLVENGVDEKIIKFELFGTAAPKARPTVIVEKGKQYTVEVTKDGDRNRFSLPQDGQVLLDAMENKNLDLPYSCKGGVCCTCKAKLVSGEVDMLVNYALDDEEVKQGYILTCQAIPKSDHITIDFDDI